MKIKRDFRLTLEMGKKTRVFVFSQASAYETLRFAEEAKEEAFDIVLWTFRFLNETCRLEKPHWFDRANISRKEFTNCALELPKLFETIRTTYFRGAFSEKTIDSSEDTMPFDAYCALLSEKLSIDPMRLLKEYTFEQIHEVGKGVVYVMNMASEEGQKRNRNAQLAEKMTDKNREEVKNAIAQLEEWQKSHFSK